MRLLLGSGGFRTPERVEFLAQQMRAFFGNIPRILFIPYALADHDGYVRMLTEKGIHAGYQLDGIHRHADPAHAVREARGVFVGGGNTFRLLTELYRRDLLSPLRERVRSGLPYLGVSAGTNVACPTIQTTNDMPIVQPPSFAALGLVPFQINPHYYHGHTFVREGEEYREHFGETRDERIAEYHEMNDAPVVGLWEAGVIRIHDGKAVLEGAAARLFVKGREPVDLQPGSRLEEWLPKVDA